MTEWKAGDIVHVTGLASVQFTVRPILFRVIRKQDTPTYAGWVWLDGYELDEYGDAVEHRSIFVQPDGLTPGVIQPRPAQEPKKPRKRPPAPSRRNRARSDPDRDGNRRTW